MFYQFFKASTKCLSKIAIMNTHINKIPVLIVDDDNSCVLLLQEYFEKLDMSFNIKCASNGLQAIELYNKNKFDLVFLDIVLPYLNGLEVLQNLKTKAAHTIIFAYTAYCIPTEIPGYYKAGFNEILVKPLSFDTFCKVVKKYFTF
jgi:CheY-like chemotaxis protein